MLSLCCKSDVRLWFVLEAGRKQSAQIETVHAFNRVVPSSLYPNKANRKKHKAAGALNSEHKARSTLVNITN